MRRSCVAVTGGEVVRIVVKWWKWWNEGRTVEDYPFSSVGPVEKSRMRLRLSTVTNNHTTTGRQLAVRRREEPTTSRTIDLLYINYTLRAWG